MVAKRIEKGGYEKSSGMSRSRVGVGTAPPSPFPVTRCPADGKAREHALIASEDTNLHQFVFLSKA